MEFFQSLFTFLASHVYRCDKYVQAAHIYLLSMNMFLQKKIIEGS